MVESQSAVIGGGSARAVQRPKEELEQDTPKLKAEDGGLDRSESVV